MVAKREGRADSVWIESFDFFDIVFFWFFFWPKSSRFRGHFPIEKKTTDSQCTVFLWTRGFSGDFPISTIGKSGLSIQTESAIYLLCTLPLQETCTRLLR